MRNVISKITIVLLIASFILMMASDKPIFAFAFGCTAIVYAAQLLILLIEKIINWLSK